MFGSGPLIDPITVQIQELPDSLTGLRLLHLSDLHVRRGGHGRSRYERLVREVGQVELDLLLLCGDLMNRPGDEEAAEAVVRALVAAARPRLGALGVWGNHDSEALRERLGALSVRWLSNGVWSAGPAPLTVMGVACGHQEEEDREGDLIACLVEEPVGTPEPLRVLLAHKPHWALEAASFGIDLVLAGHTHGGQVRLPGFGPLYNATRGWPNHLSSGLLRAGRTRVVVGRGLGETYVEGLRFGCPPHAPLVTLEPELRPTPRHPLRCVQRW